MTTINSTHQVTANDIAQALEEIDKAFGAKELKVSSHDVAQVKTSEMPDILNKLPGVREGSLTVSEKLKGGLKGSGSFSVQEVKAYVEAARTYGLGANDPTRTRNMGVLVGYLKAIEAADANGDGKVTASEYNNTKGIVFLDNKTLFKVADLGTQPPPGSTPPPVVSPPAPPTEKLLYQTSFDSPMPFKNASTYLDHWKFQASPMSAGQIVADPLGQRTGTVFKVQYDSKKYPGILTKNAENPRNELRHEAAMENGKTYSIKFSALFNNGTPGAIFAQIHGPSTHPPIKLSAETDGRIIVSYRDVPNVSSSKSKVIGNVNDATFKGKWVDWEITFRPDETGKALMTVSANGKELFRLENFSTETVNAKTDPNNVKHYFKMGIYKRTGDTHPATIYYDNFKMSVK